MDDFDLSTLIPWVLERIVNYEYEVSRDSKGQIESVDLDPFYGEAKKRFEVIEAKLLAGMSTEYRAAFLPLKEGYTQETLTVAMAKLFPSGGPRVAERFAERLAGATWEELVRWLDYIYTAAWEGEGEWEGMGPRLARAREGFGNFSDAAVEKLIQSSQPESLRMYIEKKYARDLIKLFPKFVDRADLDLRRLLKANLEPPNPVKRLLNEAVRCYIYGQFLGSLCVCRAAIEAGIEDRLRTEGWGVDVENINTKEGKLFKLIELAGEKRLLDHDGKKWAHDVRTLCRDAIHGVRLPSEAECRSAFCRTRGVLEFLYSSHSDPNPNS